MGIYGKWAITYNDEVMDKAQEYVAPSIVAQVALPVSDNFAQSAILNAGCDTNLIDQALNLVGAKIMDGLDLPSASSKLQTKRVYRSLSQADLTQRVQKEDEIYDLVTCVSTFTKSHVSPDPAIR